MAIEATVEKFRGRDVLMIKKDGVFVFGCGLRKAKIIVENIDLIRRFIEKKEASSAERGEKTVGV